MAPKSALLAALAAAVPAIAQDCDCYLIDGNYPTYYSNYRLWDFRSMPENAVDNPTPLIPTREGNLNAGPTTPYFSYDGGAFTEFWGPQQWSNGNETFMNIPTYNNLYIDHATDGDVDTYLTMRTARQGDFQSSAEFESIEAHDHASMRMRARSFGSPGACTAMFTYFKPEGGTLIDVEEADIEMLTREPTTTIHYTNQPSYLEDGTTVDGASNTLTVSPGWDQWIDHRQDWTPGRTTWYYNGVEQHSQTFQAPEAPARLVFNAWSDGQVWTGLMEEGGSAYQQIQWIEIAYGLTDAASCSNVCNIDDEGFTGGPRSS